MSFRASTFEPILSSAAGAVRRNQAGVFARACELGAFREEAVSGVKACAPGTVPPLDLRGDKVTPSAGAAPMAMASSASRTCRALVRLRIDRDRLMPSSRHARITRTAISPRFAIRSRESFWTSVWKGWSTRARAC